MPAGNYFYCFYFLNVKIVHLLPRLFLPRCRSSSSFLARCIYETNAYVLIINQKDKYEIWNFGVSHIGMSMMCLTSMDFLRCIAWNASRKNKQKSRYITL